MGENRKTELQHGKDLATTQRESAIKIFYKIIIH